MLVTHGGQAEEVGQNLACILCQEISENTRHSRVSDSHNLGLLMIQVRYVVIIAKAITYRAVLH